jgi:hypothetical protein
MRLTKPQEILATNEMLAMLARNKQNGGNGLRTSELRGTSGFHGMKTLSLNQVIRLLRKSGKATPEWGGSYVHTYYIWSLTDEAWAQARLNRKKFFAKVA